MNAADNKPKEFRKGLRYWSDMTRQYSDMVSDEATLKAYKDGGAKYVRWITQEDEKVCEVCWERNGKIYPIDRVPAKPHWGCRCYLRPVSKGFNG